MSDQPIQGYGGKVETGGGETPIKDWRWTVERPTTWFPYNPRDKRNLSSLVFQAANAAHVSRHGKSCVTPEVVWGKVQLKTASIRIPVENMERSMIADADAAEFDRLWKEAGGS